MDDLTQLHWRWPGQRADRLAASLALPHAAHPDGECTWVEQLRYSDEYLHRTWLLCVAGAWHLVAVTEWPAEPTLPMWAPVGRHSRPTLTDTEARSAVRLAAELIERPEDVPDGAAQVAAAVGCDPAAISLVWVPRSAAWVVAWTDNRPLAEQTRYWEPF